MTLIGHHTAVLSRNVDTFPTAYQNNSLKELYLYHKRSQKANNAAVPTCKIHPSQPLDFYCKSCNSLVCSYCVISSCMKRNHEHGFIKDMVEKYQTILVKELKPIQKLHQQMKDALEIISTSERELQVKQEEELRKVESTFNALSEILAQEKRHFTEAIMSSFQEQNHKNSSKRTELSDKMGKLSSLIDNIQISCQNDSKEDFLADASNKRESIKLMKKDAKGLSPNVEKIPKVEVHLLNTTELKTLCQVKNFTCQIDSPFESYTTKMCTPLSLPLKLTIGRKCLGKVESQLECNYDTCSLKADIEQISPEKISLSVTPQKRGNHKLLIKCDGVHICGSPIPIYVTVNPKEIMTVSKPKLEKHLCNGYPSSVKVHSGNIYLTNDKELIVLEAKSMNEITTLILPGINEALIEKDHLYYTDRNSHRLVKTDLNGTPIFSTGTQGDKEGQFDFPNGIRLSKDKEIYVCDSDNHRIQVFDQDLKFLRILGSQEGCFNTPNDLDFDETGNIYVVDQKNHRIRVLTTQGNYIRSIGQCKSEKEKLKNPVSVAIDRNMVYITDTGNKRISVFTTMGEFIATFGNGILKRPETIAIDENGHIFVTDSKECALVII